MNITYHDVFGYLAGILMAVGMLPYIWSVVWTKETKLNRSSWIIWSCIGTINLLAYTSAGEKETVWFVLIGAINPVVLLLLSFKYGIRNWYQSDTYCIILAGMAVVIWKTTGNPVLAVVAGLAADGIGIVPLFLKIRKDSSTENLLSWLIGFVSSICNLFAIREWTWMNGIYTIYMAISFAVILKPLVKGRLIHKTASI